MSKHFINVMKNIVPELSSEMDAIETLIDNLGDSIFNVVNLGLLNPGKSTLFNALLKEEEIFKTADVRQTIVNQEVMYNNEIRLIDTPGCNSFEKNDDKETLSAIRRADLILFVHNINTGGLNKAELKMLKTLRAILGETDFIQRTAVVCNRTDEIETDDILSCNMTEIKSQIEENLYVVLKVFAVSPILYLMGIKSLKNNKTDEANCLIESSGLCELINFVETTQKKLGKRSATEIFQLLGKLRTVEIEQGSKNMLLKRERETQIKKTLELWDTTLGKVRPSWQACKDVLSKGNGQDKNDIDGMTGIVENIASLLYQNTQDKH